MSGSNKWQLVRTVALPVIGGSIVGALANTSSKNKYKKLDTPNFAPPGWVFPVAWTTLYATMGIAKYKFDQTSKQSETHIVGKSTYTIQLCFNFLWSFLFFRWNLRGTALIDAMLLWTAVVLNTYYFFKTNKLSGTLMMPYIGWTTYAVVLNYATWKMNQDI